MTFNHIKGWAFLGLLTDGRGAKRLTPLFKICHTYPTTMMKLGTVIPYLKKIQKIYKSFDTSADISIFSL